MSAVTAEAAPQVPGAAADALLDPERQLERALIRLCALSEHAIDEIWDTQRNFNISFSEAARRLGYVSQADIDSAVASSRKIAVIEKRPLRPSIELVLPHDPFSEHAEKLRALRTELLLRHEGGTRGNLIAVLSPCAGEGRSQLAAELAIAFSQLGQSTLLVDADFRRPRQHTLFGADNQQGLSQAIMTGDTPYVQPVENLPHLWVLTAGMLPPNPAELLSDGRFEALIDHWRRRYEHVVIDTAPVSQYSDALAVATLVSRALVLSRAQHTPYKATREMLRRLSATQSQILGAVINHF